MTFIVPVVPLAGIGDPHGEVELPDFVFGLSEAEIAQKIPLVHQVVVAQLAAARRGTASTLTRAAVSGGGAKPYRQKGTGRARQGSIRAPQFKGGGVVHGPSPRSYEQRTPKKMKAGALRALLSDRALNDRIHVVAGQTDERAPSTRSAKLTLSTISQNKKTLVVVCRDADQVTWKSAQNLRNVHLLDEGQLNAYDVSVSDDVVFTEDALQAFVTRVSQSPTWRGWVAADAAFIAAEHEVEYDLGAPATERRDEPLRKTRSTSIVKKTGPLTGDDIRAAAMEHPDIRTYTTNIPSVDGTAFETDEVDVVAIERHQDFVMVSWPTNLTGERAADIMFRTLDTEHPTEPPWFFITVDGETVEQQGKFDREDLRKRAQAAQSLRIELDRQTLAWRLPTDGERQPRFVAYEFELPGYLLYRLLNMTADPPVRNLVNRVVGDKPRTMLPLSATSKPA